MAQSSKITSRPMTKALGTASILSMAIAGANMANAIQTDFGVTYQADAYSIDGDAYGSESSETALANLLRLKADFKDETTGTSLHTTIQLAGDYWGGDSREDGGSFTYNDDGNESVTLDTAYVQVPVAGNLLRVGRQATSWNNCLLVCDDRRDRIGMVFPTAAGTFVANYDRRSDTTAFETSDQQDQVSLAYLTRLQGWNVGMLWVYYPKNQSDGAGTFQDAHILSPYVSGQLTEGMNLAVGLNWFGGNDKDPGAFGSGDHLLPGDSTGGLSGYLRLEGDIGALNYGVQYLGAVDGGVVSYGYDTYLGVLNNSPESTANPTSLAAMGRGLGLEDYNEHLIAAKLGFDITPQFNLTGAVGYYMVETPYDENDPVGAGTLAALGLGSEDDSSMLYDITATYKINDNVSTHLTWTMMESNESMFQDSTGGLGSNGNALIGNASAPDFNDDEDLMAVNLGLNVKF